MKYPRENAGGAIYTVDEVSALLGIPRPTLYRYLREYSIPHLRREGRISIPEDSFDRIREARDLHKEGLGTETVRRQLREGNAPDSGELDRRLDSLHRTLEDLREDINERPASTGELAFSPTLRTILARQSLLMSAVFNLTEMVEELLHASGKPRKPLFVGLETREVPARDPLEIPGEVAVGTATVPPPDQGENLGLTLEARSTDFGGLRRRRRRGVWVIVAALLLLACLVWSIPVLVGANNAGLPVTRLSTDERLDAPEAIAAGSDAKVHTRVPDVSGLSLEEAVRIISDAGFEVTDIKTEASQRAQDTAIRTEPTAGAPAKSGTPVVLTMSGGAAPAVQTASATASASAGYAN